MRKRKFPAFYGKLLGALYEERDKADYGEYVPTMESDVEKRIGQVARFIRRAQKEIPPVAIEQVLEMLLIDNPAIRDFSFDIYCPRSYRHHTRFTVWCPKGRVTRKWLDRLLDNSTRTLKNIGVKEHRDYVLGLNSRVNQYKEQHLIMLDFDNISTVPYQEFRDEPGFFFRTFSGFHFIGSQLYGTAEWRKRMKKFSKIASMAHYIFSRQRGYATLRITASPRKPIRPTYIGRSDPRRRSTKTSDRGRRR